MTVVKAAEADAESKYLAGMGIARQRQAIVNGLRDSVRDFSTEVSGIEVGTGSIHWMEQSWHQQQLAGW